MARYALGLDYGTNSCRALIVDLDAGCELADAAYDYPSGALGILLDPRDPNLARQNPRDYVAGLSVVRRAVAAARKARRGFDPKQIVGIGVDTTGSTPIPVDRKGAPLALSPKFRKNLSAMAWLWKDHTGHAEAAQITALARRIRPQYLARCGGTYSPEWFWAKLLHLRNAAPDIFAATHSFVECCDYIPALLCGETRPEKISRSVCAAGHKAMYCEEWGGLPDKTFLAALHPDLARMRERLYSKAYCADRRAGSLSAAWAKKLGLRPGIAVAVGSVDGHVGAVGAGVREGTLVKILGTSACDMMVIPNAAKLAEIPGVCGIVDGAILPGFYGIEAGQAAVGDLFLWFVRNLVPAGYGRTAERKFRSLAERAARQRPGEHGLLALDWNNGNRCVLVDPRLSGLLIGQTLHTEAHEIYRALIEATAFGALTIIRRIEEHGVRVREIVNCGGLAVKNELLMQIYADVTGRPMKLAAGDQTCALGAAIFGAVAAGHDGGGFATVQEAQARLSRVREKSYLPDKRRQAVYADMYGLYRTLHDAFGTPDWSGKLDHVMKQLIALRERQRER